MPSGVSATTRTPGLTVSLPRTTGSDCVLICTSTLIEAATPGTFSSAVAPSMTATTPAGSRRMVPELMPTLTGAGVESFGSLSPSARATFSRSTVMTDCPDASKVRSKLTTPLRVCPAIAMSTSPVIRVTAVPSVKLITLSVESGKVVPPVIAAPVVLISTVTVPLISTPGIPSTRTVPRPPIAEVPATVSSITSKTASSIRMPRADGLIPVTSPASSLMKAGPSPTKRLPLPAIVRILPTVESEKSPSSMTMKSAITRLISERAKSKTFSSPAPNSIARF